MRFRPDVEVVHRLGYLERFQDGELQRRSRKIFFKWPAIDLDHPAASQEPNSGDSGFAAAGSIK
jgi:hypothetical protein